MLLPALLLLASGCGTFRRVNYGYRHTYFPVSESKNYGFSRRYPNSFTVYPFKNLSWYKDASARARQATFQAFSLIGPCSPMPEVDRLASFPYTDQDALRVARELKTDAVIIGDVTTQDHIWALLFSYSYVKINLRIYDTRTGKILWKGGNWSQDTKVGLGILLEPIMVMISHGLWSRTTTELYYMANMDIIAKIRPDVLALYKLGSKKAVKK
jgi:hypothetical protein